MELGIETEGDLQVGLFQEGTELSLPLQDNYVKRSMIEELDSLIKKIKVRHLQVSRLRLRNQTVITQNNFTLIHERKTTIYRIKQF